MAKRRVAGGRPYTQTVQVAPGVTNFDAYSCGQWMSLPNHKEKVRLARDPKTGTPYLITGNRKRPKISTSEFRLVCGRDPAVVLPAAR